MKHLFILLLFLNLNAFAGPLNIAIVQEWSAFNPITSQLASNEALFPFIIRKMVRRSADGGVVADVAEKVPALKGLSAEWQIRKNAKWADGVAITCADWQLGWLAGMNPKVSVESRSNFDKITGIEWSEKTPQTCRVSYKTGDWSYDRDLPPLIPAHLEKSTYEKFKGEAEGYDRNTGYISDPLQKGLYNGPYYVSEFKLGSHVILTRNEHFYGTKPQMEKIIIKHVPDTGSLRAQLLSSQINAISAVGFPPDTALMLDEEFRKSGLPYQVRFQNSGIFQGLYFNLESEIFKDKAVREAFSRAIDKENIVKAFFNSRLQRAESILSPQHPSYTEQAPIHSKETARKLLDAAGWKMGAGGVREKNKKALSFVFKTSAGLKVLENIQVYVCEQLKSIGAQCNIKNEPPRILLGQSVPHGEFDMAMFGQPIPPDTSITPYFSAKEIPTAKNSWAGGNSIRLNSPEVDALLAQFDSEKDRKKRNVLIKKVESVLQKNYFMIPLYHRREAIVMPKGLSGLSDSFEGTAYALPELWVWK